MMKEDLEKSVLKTLDAEEKIMPYLPDLLRDLWSLGSPPERIIDVFKPLNLPKLETRVLDLGCGKGAISIILAYQLGFQVLGIDGCKEFLEEAQEKAIEYGVESLCEFKFADIREFVKQAQGYDVVIYASVGNVLGSHLERVGKLRKCIRSGGYMLIDDGYLKGKEGYSGYLSHDETLAQLLYYGDKLLREVEYSDEETRDINERYLKVINRRAKEIMGRRTDLVALLENYIHSQEQECERMDKYFRWTTWLLQRVG